MSKQQANLVCLLVAAIWGGGFIATDAALQTFDPFTVLMIRFIGASIVSIIVCLVSRVKISSLVSWKYFRCFNVLSFCVSNLRLILYEYRSKCLFNSCQCCSCTLYRMGIMEKETEPSSTCGKCCLSCRNCLSKLI